MFSKTETTTLIVLSLLLVVATILASQEPQIIKDLKSGKKTLECQFQDGWREVPANKIVGINDDGSWAFTNGYAHNCEIY